MKIRILIFLFFFAAGNQLKAQYYFYDGNFYDNPLVFEFGGSVGGINALTDLGGRKGIGKHGIKDFNFKNTNVCGGVFFSAVYKNSFALRIEGTFGQVHSYDSILKKVASTTSGRYERNLSFRSNISEISLVAEFHPFYIFGDYNDDHYPPAISPYIVAGVGYFHFNPQIKLPNGNYADLQPLSTEGEGFSEYQSVKTYKLNQINFPIGIGARYDLSPIINLRAEMVYRILTTDYLDDVSGTYIDPSAFANHLSGTQLQEAIYVYSLPKPGAETAHPGGIRGNPKNNDAYITFNFKIGLTIGRERRN